MNAATPYRPYTSDTESGSDSEYDSDTSSDVSIADVVSPAFTTLLLERSKNIHKRATSAQDNKTDQDFSMEGVDMKKPINYGATKFGTTSKGVTTQLIVQSTDRDRQAYPTPTDFTIHFPRTYKNVVGIDLANINFLNTLLFFRNSRYNTYFDIIESGRPKPDFDQFPTKTNEDPYVLRAQIREGSYNSGTLTTELLYSLNTAPPFFYYPNGFSDFAPLFAASGAYSLIFNQPGDYFFDSLNDQFISVKSIDEIILKYFSATNANQTRYTNSDILAAYYYPVIKEAFLDPEEYLKLDKQVTEAYLFSGEDLETRVIYNFQGLDDPIILELIELNRAELDLFRNRLTYLAYPVNKYAIRENAFNKHLVVSATGLATSIQNSVAYQSNLYLQGQLQAENISLQQYSNIIGSNRNDLATLSEMRDFLFSNVSRHFGITFNSYEIGQIFCNSTLFNIQNGYNACNVINNYTSLSNVQLAPDYSKTAQAPQILFSNLSNLDPVLGSSYDPDEFNNARVDNLVIDVDAAIFNPNPRFSILKTLKTNTGIGDLNFNESSVVDTNGFLNINPKNRSIDFIAKVKPTKYSVFKFKSPCRQTIQIETLPLPHKFRYPTYTNIAFGKEFNKAFNQSYEFNLPYIKDLSNNILDYKTQYIDNFATNSLKNIYVVHPTLNVDGTDISNELLTPLNAIGNYKQQAALDASSNYLLQVTDNIYYFKFQSPFNPNVLTNINITIESRSPANKLESNIVCTIYADYSAFIADTSYIEPAIGRVENPLLYLMQAKGGLNEQHVTIEGLPIKGGDTYYILLRSEKPNFTNTLFGIYGWFSNSNKRLIQYDLSGSDTSIPFYLQNPETNANMYKDNETQYTNADYFRVYDRAHLKLPYYSNLYANTDPENNTFNDPLIPDQPNEPYMGYDENGISTDLTDYKGVSMDGSINNQKAIYLSHLRYDPISGYLFNAQCNSPYAYNKTQQKYIFDGSPNEILEPTSNAPYVPAALTGREYKIVHWNDSHFIPPQEDDLIHNPDPATYSSNMRPYTIFEISGGYYESGANQNTLFPRTNGRVIFQNNTYFNAPGSIRYGKGVTGFGFLPSDGEWQVNNFMFKSAYHQEYTDPNRKIQFIGIFDTSSIVGYNINSITLSNASFIMKRKGTNYQSNYTTAFDKQLGAYHYFEYLPSSNSPYTYLQKNLAGYTPNPTNAKTYQDNRISYSALPFDSSGNLMTYFMPSGSLIAHQECFDISTNENIISDVVYYKNPYYRINHTVSQGAFITLPNYLAQESLQTPEYIEDEGYTNGSNLLLISKYEQSLPIMLPKLQYKDDLPFILDDDALKNYNPTPLISYSDARLHSLNSSNQYDYPSPSFVIDPSDFYVYKFNINKTETASNVTRSFDNRSIINYKQIITDCNVYNPSTETILTWAENAFAKYALIYGKDPNNINDVKLIKVVGGDDNDTPNVSIFMNYTGFSNSAGITYNGKKLSYIDSNYPVKLVVTNGENMMFSARHSVCNNYINIFSSMRDIRNNNTYNYGFNCYDAIPLSNFRESIIMPEYNNTYSWFSIIYENNGDVYYSKSQNILNAASAGNIGYEIMDSSHNVIYYTTFKNYLPDAIKNTAYDFRGHSTFDNNNLSLYCLDSNDPYHIQAILDDLPQGIGNGDTYETIGSANNILTYGNTITTRNKLQRVSFNTSSFALKYKNNEYNFDWGFGYRRMLFMKWQIDSFYNEPAWEVYGNSQEGADLNKQLTPYTQSFYPTMKIGLKKIHQSFNSITDSQLLIKNPIDSNVITPEWPRTQMFLYSNYDSFKADAGAANSFSYDSNDINGNYNKLGIYKYSNNVMPFKWGCESNFIKGDICNNGYYMNSYVYNMTLSNTTDPTQDYYLAIRGSLPSEGFQTLVRINAPNRLDFGFITMPTLINEISDLYLPNLRDNYNPDYLKRIREFNDAFKMSNNFFGDGFYSNYSGLPITTINSADRYFPTITNLNQISYVSCNTNIDYSIPHGALLNWDVTSRNLTNPYNVADPSIIEDVVYKGVAINSGLSTITLSNYTYEYKFTQLPYNTLTLSGDDYYDFNISNDPVVTDNYMFYNFDASGDYFYNESIRIYYNSVPNTFFYYDQPKYYQHFYSNLSNIYTRYTSNVQLIDRIQTNVASSMSNYLSSYWSDLLPQYAINRDRVTDPITFSLRFQDSVPEVYKDLEEEWGLGWNLGFPKSNTQFATVHFATNIYKIFFETIYLRLADYQGSMNLIDKTARERLAITNEPQGQTKQYFAKLLLNSFGNYSSTTFQNPPSFNPPIARLDKIRFQWIDPAGNIVDNTECDWNAVLRVTEQLDTATADSTFIKDLK